jgi:hypothetical protein
MLAAQKHGWGHPTGSREPAYLLISRRALNSASATFAIAERVTAWNSMPKGLFKFNLAEVAHL